MNAPDHGSGPTNEAELVRLRERYDALVHERFAELRGAVRDLERKLDAQVEAVDRRSTERLKTLSDRLWLLVVGFLMLVVKVLVGGTG